MKYIHLFLKAFGFALARISHTGYFSLQRCMHAQPAIIWIISQIMNIYKIPMLLALTAEC